MLEVAIINESMIVSDTDGAMIVGGLNIILPQFCTDWNIGSTICICE
jgi:hypothetical protein